MKYIYKLLIPGLIILIAFLLLPNFSFAQSRFIVCNGPDCTICDFLILVKNAITFVIELCIILAALFFAGGAIIMMTARESEEQVKMGRKMMTDSVIGAAIALSSWVIVGTIMQFLSGSSSKLPWSEIECILK